MSRSLNILYIAYSLLPVSNESCGGAEQVLCTLEREMNRGGHRTTVAACSGSRAAGELLATGSPAAQPDCLEERQAEHHAAILDFISSRRRNGEPLDLIHDHSGAFWPLAHKIDVPVLATLHLPRSYYPPDAFQDLPANVWLNCVSQSQFETCCDIPNVVGAVGNGVDLELFKPALSEREGYLLWMGRICEEKGPHVALDVAAMAGLPLVLVGKVYPFSYHQNYYEREILPRLEKLAGQVRHFSRASIQDKIGLLQRAHAVLIPSAVEETSSLVAMEAMACGTPVIAFRRGALAEIIQEENTGFLVNSTEEMAEMVKRAREIDPSQCRRYAERFHSAKRMSNQYESHYQRLLERATRELGLTAEGQDAATDFFTRPAA